jgi:hypothetical protein
MKTTKTTFLISIALIFSLLSTRNMAFAQITLEKTYTYSTTVGELSSGEYVYYLMDVPLGQCRIYNTNHILTKTINLSIPSGYYLSDLRFVSRNLFNTDNLIELLYVYEKYVTTTSAAYYQYGLAVVNENGTQLLTLNDGAYAEVQSIGTSTRLLAYTYKYNTLGYYDVTTNIYLLGGSSTAVLPRGTDEIKVYPNPAEGIFHVKTSGNLYRNATFTLRNMSGNNVATLPLSGDDCLDVPVSEFAAGTYLWNVSDPGKIEVKGKIVLK